MVVAVLVLALLALLLVLSCSSGGGGCCFGVGGGGGGFGVGVGVIPFRVGLLVLYHRSKLSLFFFLLFFRFLSSSVSALTLLFAQWKAERTWSTSSWKGGPNVIVSN